MGKKLIGIENLDAAICQASGKLYVDRTIILTPGAKDELARRRIPIVYESWPEAAGCACASAPPPRPAAGPAACSAAPGVEQLRHAVAGILKGHYGVSDPEQLEAMSRQVIETIKENI